MVLDMNDRIVIDVSHWQPSPDWVKVRAGGTQGVILKCTEGSAYFDPTYDGRYIGARENGLLTSSYHFLRPGSMEDQMYWYIQHADVTPGRRLVLDYEDENVSFNDLELAARILFDKTECEVTIYGSNVLVDACKGKRSEVLARTSLWQARYGSNEPAVPSIWPTWSLWQWTDKGEVPGINGDVDCNRWNGHPDKLPGWFDKAMTVPVPAPPQPDEGEVTIDVTASATPGVKIYLTINGRKIVLE
jgi:lysozyme